MTKQAIYSPEGNVVRFVEAKASFWDTLIGATSKAIDDVKKAPSRRKALNTFADHLLREEYIKEERAKADKKTQKELKKRTKLEQVVEEATL